MFHQLSLFTRCALTLSLGSSVNSVMPGIFPSKMTAFGYKTQGQDGMAAGQPMGRTGTPRDMAGVGTSLLSFSVCDV